ncbi:MAG: hypothetical protein DRO00_01170 [Thermoproteota archaeon]|nr:MAG: hypothetical protein DRO00_01170 [Candidatus Korarchaeota archaeon]
MKTLKLDLDGKNGLDVFLERAWIMKYMGLKVVAVRCSHTTNGYHLELDLDNEIDDIKAVFMQLALGSDYRREVCNLLRIERGCKDWNILFKRKFKINKLGQRVKVSEEKYDPELSQKILDILQLGE